MTMGQTEEDSDATISSKDILLTETLRILRLSAEGTCQEKETRLRCSIRETNLRKLQVPQLNQILQCLDLSIEGLKSDKIGRLKAQVDGQRPVRSDKHRPL